jgi:carboxymethylenebutenolidase
MRSTLFSAPALLLLGACATGSAGDQAHLDAMSREHAGHTPAANASAREPRQPVRAEEVTYGTVAGKPARGYYARPANARPGERLPAILVIHEWWGLNDNVRMMARRFAGEGYQVLAVDLFGGRVAATPQEARQLTGEVMANNQTGVDHMTAAARWVKDTRGAPKVGVVGWCFGGAWALQTALFAPEAIDAAVMYYGRVETDRTRLARLDAPLLGLFGEADTGIPVEGVRRMEATLRELGKDVAIQVYPGAKHAFANPSGEAFDPPAAEDAWRRTTAHFARHLRGS